jgi:hypothetical protein
MKTRLLGTLGMVVLLAMVGSTTALASPSDPCKARLIVELTPDIPNPSDPEFLSSLLNSHMDSQLNWVRAESGSRIVVELRGPGPEAQCRSVIETMLKDGRVLSIHPDTEDAESVVLMLGVPQPERSSRVEISHDGLGALFSTAGRLAQTFKILLPVPGPPEYQYADLKEGCRLTQIATGDSAACS